MSLESNDNYTLVHEISITILIYFIKVHPLKVINNTHTHKLEHKFG